MGRILRPADVNAVVGGLLRDLAFAQTSQQRMFGYKRAAAAVLSLEQPLTNLVQPDRTLPKIPGIDSFADSNAKRIRLVTLRDASSQGKIHHANVVGRLILDGPVDAGNHV